MTETRDRASRFAVVLSTAGSDQEAEAIARSLVEARLAACVNVVGSVVSIYRWDEAVHRDAERLLVIKTRRELFPRVAEAIRSAHSYLVPEILLVPLDDADGKILDWLEGALLTAEPGR